ncbi:MAG: hypothetical protein HQL29_03720 [Candidatus Omnitrophica bacterium]|nr:hypothetical protein [Candidatus Omnitrophota bacterium]
MIVLVKLVAILMMLAGSVILLKDGVIDKMMDYIREGNRIYIAGALRIIVGLCFLAVAPQAGAPWILVIVGLLAIACGALVFVWKKEKSIEVVNKIIGDEPEKRKRIVGAIPLLLGVIILLAI